MAEATSWELLDKVAKRMEEIDNILNEKGSDKWLKR